MPKKLKEAESMKILNAIAHMRIATESPLDWSTTIERAIWHEIEECEVHEAEYLSHGKLHHHEWLDWKIADDNCLMLKEFNDQVFGDYTGEPPELPAEEWHKAEKLIEKESREYDELEKKRKESCSKCNNH